MKVGSDTFIMARPNPHDAPDAEPQASPPTACMEPKG